MKTGTLYVIGTPIGNLGDITLRAIETLGKIEVLFCEDSRVSSRLINHLLEKKMITGKPRYVPYNEFNEDRIFAQAVELVAEGAQVGLVSDAGMPAISDPGYRVIRACLDRGVKVEVIPGATALATALTMAGIGGEAALYLGFLPKTSGKALKSLQAAKKLLEEIPSARIVLYVSPHRLTKDLERIIVVLGEESRCVLLREMTKQFEERIEGSARELLDHYTIKPIKGELVLVVSQQRAAGH